VPPGPVKFALEAGLETDIAVLNLGWTHTPPSIARGWSASFVTHTPEWQSDHLPAVVVDQCKTAGRSTEGFFPPSGVLEGISPFWRLNG
jgi:hypothetical protein